MVLGAVPWAAVHDLRGQSQRLRFVQHEFLGGEREPAGQPTGGRGLCVHFQVCREGGRETAWSQDQARLLPVLYAHCPAAEGWTEVKTGWGSGQPGAWGAAPESGPAWRRRPWPQQQRGQRTRSAPPCGRWLRAHSAAAGPAGGGRRLCPRPGPRATFRSGLHFQRALVVPPTLPV